MYYPSPVNEIYYGCFTTTSINLVMKAMIETMNTKTQDIIEIEKHISQAQPAISKLAALERLKLNSDFQTLIINGYLATEAVRLVHLKADPSLQTPEHQAKITRDIDAIGALNMFFIAITQEGNRGIAAKEDGEAALVDLMNEED